MRRPPGIAAEVTRQQESDLILSVKPQGALAGTTRLSAAGIALSGNGPQRLVSLRLNHSVPDLVGAFQQYQEVALYQLVGRHTAGIHAQAHTGWATLLAYICNRIVGKFALPTPPPALAAP